MKSNYHKPATQADLLTEDSYPSDQLIEQAWETFRSFLKERGDRITETRQIVLAKSLARKDHFQADDLATELARGRNRVSRGTVYRTLALLVEAGILREIRDHDTHAHYEPLFGRVPHEHMICDKCGKFIEFVDDNLLEHIREACQSQNFMPRTHHVTIFGLCDNCQSK